MNVENVQSGGHNVRCKTRAEHRKLLKKEKRRKKRQQSAILRQQFEENNEEKLTPRRLEGEEARERQLDVLMEQEKKRQHEMWLERERQAQEEFQKQRQKEEMLKKKEDEERKRIQAEWEEEQRKEQEKLKKEKTKKDEKQQQLEGVLQYLDKGNKNGEQPWRNPDAPIVVPGTRKAETCSFFKKTGACRFGERCSRNHPDPGISRTVLLKGMYSNFSMEQSFRDEYDTDISLEYDQETAEADFREFYSDTLPEFEKIGRVVVMKACCNWEQHLRGNVYVQYQKEEHGTKAVETFNGRFYAGKSLSCEYVALDDWRAAICGLFPFGTCPKGKNCNYLHVFKDPKDETAKGRTHRRHGRSDFKSFSDRRWRQGSYPLHQWRHRLGSERRNHSHTRSRSRSRSRSTERKRSKQRSEVRVKSHSRRRSRSRRTSRSRSPSRRRSRSKSRSPSRRRSRSKSRSPTRSWSESKRNSPSHKGSRSKSKSPSRRSNSRSKSPPRRRRSRSKTRSPISRKTDSVSRSRSRNRDERRRNRRSRSRSRSKSRSHSSGSSSGSKGRSRAKSKSKNKLHHRGRKSKKQKVGVDTPTEKSKSSLRNEDKTGSQNDTWRVKLEVITEKSDSVSTQKETADADAKGKSAIDVENLLPRSDGETSEDEAQDGGESPRTSSSSSSSSSASGNEAASEDSDSSEEEKEKLDIVEMEIARLNKRAEEKEGMTAPKEVKPDQ